MDRGSRQQSAIHSMKVWWVGTLALEVQTCQIAHCTCQSFQTITEAPLTEWASLRGVVWLQYVAVFCILQTRLLRPALPYYSGLIAKGVTNTDHKSISWSTLCSLYGLCINATAAAGTAKCNPEFMFGNNSLDVLCPYNLFVLLFHICDVVVDDVFCPCVAFVLLLATTYSLQHGFQASPQSGEVRLGQQRGHLVKRVLRQRRPHDITDVVLGQRQETEAQPSGAADPEDGTTKGTNERRVVRLDTERKQPRYLRF